MKPDDAIWLVRSGGRILGPFTPADIGRLVRQKEISLVDEASPPFRRWLMIRQIPAFSSLIDDWRTGGGNTDDVTTSGGSLTDSVTENLTGSYSDDITEELSEFQSQLKEIVYEDVPEAERGPGRHGHQGRYQAALAIDQKRLRQEAEKSSRWMWVLTLLVFVSVAGLLGTKRLFKNQLSVTGASAPWAAGLALYADGDFAPALDFLKQAYAQDVTRKEVWFPLAILLVQNEGQTVESRRLLQKVLDERSDPPAAAMTGMALTFLQDGDASRALEQLKKAEEADPDFLPVKVNLGVVALLNRDYRGAHQVFNQAVQRGFKEGSAIVQLVTAQIFQWKEGEKSLLSDAARALGSFQKQSLDYQQELLLAQTYVEFLRGDHSNLDTRLRKILDVDPQQTDDFRHSPLVSRHMADWGHLGQWCKQLSEVGGDLPAAVALRAICQYKQGQALSAKIAIEKAVNQAPRDPLLQAVYAAVLRAAGFAGEASVALGRAIELDRRGEYLLPVLLQARFCQEREDWECASNYWLKVLSVDPQSPAGKIGMAQVYWSRQARTEAQRLIQEVGFVASEYKPYLRLRRQVGSSKKGI